MGILWSEDSGDLLRACSRAAEAASRFGKDCAKKLAACGLPETAAAIAAAEWFSELASDIATEVGGGGGGIGNGSPCPPIERFIKLAAAAACS